MIISGTVNCFYQKQLREVVVAEGSSDKSVEGTPLRFDANQGSRTPMAARRKTTRRQFLRGRAAVEALQDLAGGAAEPFSAPPAAATESSAAPAYLVQISRRAMATDFEIFLNAAQHGRDTESALQALDLVEELEGQLTVYRPHSEVMGINRRAADGPITVEARLFALLQLAVNLSRDTGGAFDITSGPLSQVWGFYRRAGQLPDAESLQQALLRVGYRWLELDDERHTIRFLRRGVEINLNALGKGYAVDRCAELLLAAGVEDFLIHGGQSSVLAGGSRAGAEADARGWSVALRHPLKPQQRLAEIWLHNRAWGRPDRASSFSTTKAAATDTCWTRAPAGRRKASCRRPCWHPARPGRMRSRPRAS